MKIIFQNRFGNPKYNTLKIQKITEITFWLNIKRYEIDVCQECLLLRTETWVETIKPELSIVRKQGSRLFFLSSLYNVANFF